MTKKITAILLALLLTLSVFPGSMLTTAEQEESPLDLTALTRLYHNLTLAFECADFDVLSTAMAEAESFRDCLAEELTEAEAVHLAELTGLPVEEAAQEVLGVLSTAFDLFDFAPALDVFMKAPSKETGIDLHLALDAFRDSEEKMALVASFFPDAKVQFELGEALYSDEELSMGQRVYVLCRKVEQALASEDIDLLNQSFSALEAEENIGITEEESKLFLALLGGDNTQAVTDLITMLMTASAIQEIDTMVKSPTRRGADSLISLCKALDSEPIDESEEQMFQKINAFFPSLRDHGELAKELTAYGDLDWDGDISATDALWVLQHTVGLHLLEPEDIPVADLDCSGDVSAVDALLMLQYTVYLIDDFPAVQLHVEQSSSRK